MTIRTTSIKTKKGTVNTNYTVDEYIEAFQPDIKLLFVRHPEHNLASLKKKFYAGVAGSLVGGGCVVL